MRTVAVVDYGSSNLKSVTRALAHVAGARWRVEVAASGAEITRADAVVFPGQGAIGDCMRRLAEHDLVVPLERAIATKPFLGICLGLQSLMDHSDEDGGVRCLGGVPGNTVRLAPDATDPDTGLKLKIPHMGWNAVHWTRAHPVIGDLGAGERFYFVHSYVVVPDDPTVVIGRTDYGGPLTVAVARDNLFAVQFHPEKSADAGLTLLSNFLAWDPAR